MNEEHVSTKSWVVWVPSECGYLLDSAYPSVVTSFEWHAQHYDSLDDANAAAYIAHGKVMEAQR